MQACSISYSTLYQVYPWVRSTDFIFAIQVID